VRKLVFDGGNVNWVDGIDAIALGDHDDNLFANGDKFGVWDGKFAAIREMQREWLEAIGNQPADMVDAHAKFVVDWKRKINLQLSPKSLHRKA
jgi:hypothetical protein